jgi:hypothetical protein
VRLENQTGVFSVGAARMWRLLPADLWMYVSHVLAVRMHQFSEAHVASCVSHF